MYIIQDCSGMDVEVSEAEYNAYLAEQALEASYYQKYLDAEYGE